MSAPSFLAYVHITYVLNMFVIDSLQKKCSKRADSRVDQYFISYAYSDHKNISFLSSREKVEMKLFVLVLLKGTGLILPFLDVLPLWDRILE